MGRANRRRPPLADADERTPPRASISERAPSKDSGHRYRGLPPSGPAEKSRDRPRPTRSPRRPTGGGSWARGNKGLSLRRTPSTATAWTP